MENHNSNAVTSRFFRTYCAYLKDQNPDTLFSWLASMHSLGDRLKFDGDAQLIKLDEFLALKSIRNYFHHHGEVVHKLKVLQCDETTLESDLMVLCLVPLAEVQAALNEEKKYRDQVTTAMKHVFRQYGDVININPAICNLVARIALLLIEHNLEPTECPAYRQLKQSIDYERENGFSHFVNPEIRCHAGSIEHVLQQMMVMPE